MNLPDDYLSYPCRRKGSDIDLFEDRRLENISSFRWPDSKPVAVAIIVNLHHFPLDMGKTPFVPTGGLERVYPDYWHYTMRDYGNRVGIYRLMKTMDALEIRPSVAINARLVKRYPALIADIDQRGWEMIACGKSMGHLHHAGLAEDDEKSLIHESLALVRAASSRPVRGWSSPAGSQSWRTCELLAEAGVEYVTDFVNDELPFIVTTPKGRLVALPVSTELSDTRLIAQQHHSTRDYVKEIVSAHRYLKEEALRRKTSRMMTISVTPWILGQAHRSAAFSDMLAGLASDPETSMMDCANILDAWKAAGP